LVSTGIISDFSLSSSSSPIFLTPLPDKNDWISPFKVPNSQKEIT
jgi:hypothetical protein